MLDTLSDAACYVACLALIARLPSRGGEQALTDSVTVWLTAVREEGFLREEVR
jgi:hypothetical protein